MKFNAGDVVPTGPYKNAIVISVAVNGWCKLRWPKLNQWGEVVYFSARSHWLDQ